MPAQAARGTNVDGDKTHPRAPNVAGDDRQAAGASHHRHIGASRASDQAVGLLLLGKKREKKNREGVEFKFRV